MSDELDQLYYRLNHQHPLADVIDASGTSEGVKKGWEHRGWSKDRFYKHAYSIFAGKGGKGPKGTTHSGYVTSFDEGKTYMTEITKLNSKHGGASGGRFVQTQHKSLEEAMAHAESHLPIENRHGDLDAK